MSNLIRQHYQLRIVATGINDFNLLPFLIDNYTHSAIQLSLQDTNFYNFYVNDDIASSNTARFYVTFIPAVVLPVDFIDFQVSNNIKNNNKLTWQVANQQTITSYQVERSFDGVNFTKIGQLQNNMQQNGIAVYNYLDECIQPGPIFYRIKALKIPTDFYYSKIVSIKTGDNNWGFIFPNPVLNNQLNLVLSFPKIGGRYLYKIVNVSGQLIKEGIINATSSQQIFNISFNEFITSGTYHLMISDAPQFSPVFSTDFIIKN